MILPGNVECLQRRPEPLPAAIARAALDVLLADCIHSWGREPVAHAPCLLVHNFGRSTLVSENTSDQCIASSHGDTDDSLLKP